MGRVCVDSFDNEGQNINLDRKVHSYNNAGSAIIISGNSASDGNSTTRTRSSFSRNSISSIYGPRLSNSSTFSDWSKNSLSSGSNVLFDVYDYSPNHDDKIEDIKPSEPKEGIGADNAEVIPAVNSFITINTRRTINSFDETNEGFEDEEIQDSLEEDEGEAEDDNDDTDESVDVDYENYYYKEEEPPVIYRCQSCYSDVCHSSLVISKDFWGNKGRAYFVKGVLNVKEDDHEVMRSMRTGDYAIKSIFCVQCDVIIGWKYVSSVKTTERYKVNKYVIEEKLLKIYSVSE